MSCLPHVLLKECGLCVALSAVTQLLKLRLDSRIHTCPGIIFGKLTASLFFVGLCFMLPNQVAGNANNPRSRSRHPRIFPFCSVWRQHCIPAWLFLSAALFREVIVGWFQVSVEMQMKHCQICFL